MFRCKLSKKQVLSLLSDSDIQKEVRSIIGRSIADKMTAIHKACSHGGGVQKTKSALNLISPELEAMYAGYLQLPPDVKDGLKGVVNDTDALTFAISVCMSGNLLSLWDYCRILILEGNAAAGTLSAILDYLFGLYVKIGCGERYRRIDTGVGNPFDSMTCDRDGASVPQGSVSVVLLRGICHEAKDGGVIRKSLVRVA